MHCDTRIPMDTKKQVWIAMHRRQKIPILWISGKYDDEGVQ
jgi:hypothetical protein